MMNQAHARRLLLRGSVAAGRAALRPSAALLPSLATASPSSAIPHSHRHFHSRGQRSSFPSGNIFAAATAAVASAALLGGSALCQCEAPSGDQADDDGDDEDLPTFTMKQVAQNNGKGDSGRVWMTYGGNVYDATDFIANHPGGHEKILLAAGGPIEPHWHYYRQHFSSDLPLQLMEKMLIGYLHPDDQDKVDEYMEAYISSSREAADPYGHEPVRFSLMKVHSEQAMNAEVPREILGREYITPVDMFYIRHHHPVPFLSKKEVEDYRLEVDLSLLSGGKGGEDQTAKLSLAQIKSLPKVEITSTLQCAGNRRSGFNGLRKTSGTSWDQGAISTAKWGGARLIDVLVLASEQLAEKEKKGGGSGEPTATRSGGGNLLQTLQSMQILFDQHPDLKHLRFESIDGMLASINILKALSPFSDVLVAYEMNGETLPRDHGYPLRVIVPGHAAVRNVKWLKKLELAQEEAEGTWQRGLNYKVLPPSVVDAKGIDLDKMPSLTEAAVFSGITHIKRLDDEYYEKELEPGDIVLVKTRGWAWAGGGRNIVRVDVTGNNGKWWESAKITHGADQPYGRAWAWVFWECTAVPAVVCEDGVSVELSCKGVDMAFNTQPESSDALWNLRGLANNSWYRLKHRI
ncbi:hypothetical protein ACHAXT_008076 [Thalassiosira profunda]